MYNTGHENDVAQRSGVVQKKNGALVEKLQHAGRGISLDVTRSDAQLDQARASLPPLEAQRRLAMYRLAVLTGRPPADMLALSGACTQAPSLVQAIPVGDGAQLLRRRPD